MTTILAYYNDDKQFYVIDNNEDVIDMYNNISDNIINNNDYIVDLPIYERQLLT